MNVCTDKPISLPPFDVLGADGNDRGMQSPGGSQRGGRAPMGNARPKPTQPMGSFNLGNMKLNGGMPMGMRNPSGDTRIHRTPSDNSFLPRNNGMPRPPSQRSSRGGKRGGGGQGRGGDRMHQEPALTIPLADVAPLEKTENAWTPNVSTSSVPATISADEPISQDVVARKVKGLLNKLTLEKFDSISDKVLEIANLSAKEKDGTTLKHCIKLIFEKATDEPNFGSVYAMLCQKLMDKITPEVKDVTVEGSNGGKLFRKYLLHRCQEDFMRGWKDKASAGGVSLNDKDGPDLMSDEYYILMKAKRQGLGLIHFIGELFKLNMLTEKIMHECVKKLLANVKEPEEEETEGLCKLMTTVGLQLDRPEAKPHMDVYFFRMAELTKNNKLPSRIRFMVQDVIDLRANKWVNRRAAAGPKTIAAIHEEAARQQEEKEMMRRTASSGGARGLPNRREQLNRGPSFRGSGDARQDMGGVPQVGADGWSTVAPAVTKKAGDLSSFGNTSRSKVSGPPSLGPSNAVFGSLSKGKRGEAKAASQNEASRQLSSTNSFAYVATKRESSDRRSSVDAEKPAERRPLKLLPRSTPVSDQGAATVAEPKAEEPSAPKKTKEEAERSIQNTLKEYLSLKDVNELLLSVKELDDSHRPLFVEVFVTQAMEMKQSDVDSIADIFKKLLSEKVLTPEDFEEGFTNPLEFLPDTAIDVPNAYKYTEQLLEAAGMDPAKAKS
ncbi:armadillo-type protein [Lobosporangium transversale]|uniref:Armadillo-type protein n=1 Tax=Lobosporangium transversale TaxID=64571 RepID=A0A1Y2GCK7_9FUNG|nr:armadillo-type protein [Lobosporangium transversale]ORZ05300.1 armadillo-type protein [Lobosporangium transversale]|eukprot:XP_021876992.1 armadillo-type protein [Lobosporangium transversale]